MAERDVLWAGGGSTANLLAVWRRHGPDALARGALSRGISAGVNRWLEAVALRAGAAGHRVQPGVKARVP